MIGVMDLDPLMDVSKRLGRLTGAAEFTVGKLQVSLNCLERSPPEHRAEYINDMRNALELLEKVIEGVKQHGDVYKEVDNDVYKQVPENEPKPTG